MSECFNPTLVRLRRVGVTRAPGVGVGFQSHAGSIEAILTLLFPPGRRISFNPTLVRLRLPAPLHQEVSDGSVSIPRWFD